MSPIHADSIRVHVFNGLLAGGAANAARTLTQGLRDRGVEATLNYAPRLRGEDPGVDWIQPATWNVPWYRRLPSSVSFRFHRQGFKSAVRGRSRGSEIFTSPRGAAWTPWPPSCCRDDGDGRPSIVHLHWMGKFIDWKSFWSTMPSDQPVVWTLHDMNALTGGCHFTQGCQRYQQGCGQCPQLPRPSDDDCSRQFHELKRASLRGIDLHVVTASRWLGERARESPILESAKSFHRIPYGLPMKRCEPIDREDARRSWGLEPDQFVFAFGALDLENRRKGTGELMAALERLGRRDRVIGLALGGGEIDDSEIGFEIRSLGMIPRLEDRISVYSACDAFVLPSTEDNLPLTGLEALASGTAIIGFDIGGIPDFVRHEQTGLTSRVDPAAMAANLERLIDDRSLAVSMGQQARRMALEQYDEAHEADAYIRLYHSLLSR